MQCAEAFFFLGVSMPLGVMPKWCRCIGLASVLAYAALCILCTGMHKSRNPPRMNTDSHGWGCCASLFEFFGGKHGARSD